MSEWTVDTLKEHFDDLRLDDQRALAAALTSAKEANSKAEEAQKAVNITQNEFRGTLKDQAATLLPTKEADAKFGDLQKQINDLATKETSRTGQKSGADISMAKVVTLVGLVATVLGIIILLANNVL